MVCQTLNLTGVNITSLEDCWNDYLGASDWRVKICHCYARAIDMPLFRSLCWLSSLWVSICLLALSILAILAWSLKLFRLFRHVSTNPFTLSHVISAVILVGNFVFIVISCLIIIPPAPGDAPSPGGFAYALLALTAVLFSAFPMYSGWWFLWCASLCFFVDLRKKRRFQLVHWGVTAAATVAFTVVVLVDFLSTCRRPMQAALTLLVFDVFCIGYFVVLFAVSLAMVFRKYRRFTPRFIFHTKWVWIAHLVLVCLGCCFMILCIVAYFSAISFFLDACIAIGGLFTVWFEVTVYLTINSNPSKPQELEHFSQSTPSREKSQPSADADPGSSSNPNETDSLLPIRDDPSIYEW